MKDVSKYYLVMLFDMLWFKKCTGFEIVQKYVYYIWASGMPEHIVWEEKLEQVFRCEV